MNRVHNSLNRITRIEDKRTKRATISDMLKFILGCKAWGNKIKEVYYSLLSLKVISFVLFPQASQPSINFNISELVYCNDRKRNDKDD